MADNSVKIPKLEIVKASFNLEVMQAGFQRLQTKANNLVVDEDHVEDVKSFMQEAKEVLNKIDDKHKELKEPYLKGGQVIDAAKRDMVLMVSKIFDPIATKYNNLCVEIQRKSNEQAKELKKANELKDSIEKNVLFYAQEIAKCETPEELNRVQSKINLQKGAKQNKDRFGSLYSLFSERMDSLNGAINQQKDFLETVASLKTKLGKEKDESAKLQLEHDLSFAEMAVDEKRSEIQQDAINSASAVVIPEVILPNVKARRQQWKYRIDDINKLHKKHPNLTEIIPNDQAIKTLLDEKKNDGSLKDKEELTINGLTFYLDKSF